MPKPAFRFTPISNQLALFDNHIPCFLPETEKHFNYACDISLPSCASMPTSEGWQSQDLPAMDQNPYDLHCKKQCLMAWHGTCSLAQAVQLEGLGKAKNWSIAQYQTQAG